jgi:hypothetical protein
MSSAFLAAIALPVGFVALLPIMNIIRACNSSQAAILVSLSEEF